MLRIDLRALREGPVDREGMVDLSEETWSEVSGELVGPVSLSYRVSEQMEGDVRVTGSLTGTLRLPCRRCLRPADERISAEFDALFRLEGGESTEAQAVYPLPGGGPMLDLTPMLREELLLAVPDWPLCRADCQGLCPHCGVDRNRESCDCALEEPDPRWDVLRTMLGS